MTPTAQLTLHASAVALNGRGLLIRGAAGQGKSALALAMLARGATLISDDRTCLAARQRGIVAWAPTAILGLIEARGVGLLTAEVAPPTGIEMVVDLDAEPAERLPRAQECDILGASIPLVAGAGNVHLSDAMLQFLKTGRRINE
ncbi:HPr kinase/phosphorylase [Palleronia abyssalis]|uniref:HPr kinase/phosphorylase n=1 Tax=Palleronia abyssalis TaxID=1501240 RepID=A0A2R8BXU1_9RHOB|nr:HPr kinase/phosphatase C-terminal domain-containing protein [Palleronia abyssalis]SPJ24942.1 HPr kinase/phosphorylase [Palleronia abyssalis]